MQTDSSTPPPSTRKKDLDCAKCGHSNAGGLNHCTSCGARLYISCHNCGHSSARIATRCGKCGSRLHRSFWRRLEKRFFGSRAKITPLQIFLLVVVSYMAYKVIIYLAEYRPPSYDGG